MSIKQGREPKRNTNLKRSLRKAFHHERISSSKKTNNEYIEVNEPRLAVALSGTPNQVTGLIATAEDGLFSRFIFYAYKVEQLWRDVSPYANNINLTELVIHCCNIYVANPAKKPASKLPFTNIEKYSFNSGKDKY